LFALREGRGRHRGRHQQDKDYKPCNHDAQRHYIPVS
jgi:hypothetical protein